MVNIVIKKFLTYIFLIVSFVSIVCLPIPKKYEIEAIILFIVFGAGIFLLLIHYFKTNIYHDNKNISLHYIFICFLLLFVSALLANINFGQPVVYGLAAGRRTIYSLLGLIFYFALRRNIVTLEEIENVMIKLFFFFFTFFFLLNVFISPQFYISRFDSDLSAGFVSFNAERGIYRYRFDISLLVWGFIYSLQKKEKKMIYIVFIGLFIFYLLAFHRGRIVLALCAAVLIYSLFFRASLNIKVNVLIITGILIPALLLFIPPNYFSVFDTILSFTKEGINALAGFDGSDTSANARIRESQIAWEALRHFSYLGVGMLSQKWEITIKSIYGRFYPSDIGLLGLWFKYSFLSVLFYFYISYKSIILYRYIDVKNPFIATCWIYTLYILLSSILTGSVFYGFGKLAIMFAVMHYSQSISDTRPWHRVDCGFPDRLEKGREIVLTDS